MIKQQWTSAKITLATVAFLILAFSLTLSGLANADALSSASTTPSTNSTTSGSTTTCTSGSTTSQQTRLTNIINRGNAEIERRLATLSTLTNKISAATHLTANDQSVLSNEVSTTTSGLNALKTQLDSETSLCNAKTDVQNIFTEYRVYAIVAPKVALIKVADDQQVVESQLTALSQKLQARISADQNAGSLQTELNDMISKTNAAQQISQNIEGSVINLVPSDYNSNHAVLSGDNTQLALAYSDNQSAYSDAKNIVASLQAQ